MYCSGLKRKNSYDYEMAGDRSDKLVLRLTIDIIRWTIYRSASDSEVLIWL